MASNINYASIDETFPVAGKDNDSQGFRDNFGYIKNSFESAKGEIEDLQSNTAKTNTDSSFNFQTISQVQIKNWGETFHDGGTVGQDTIVSYGDGSIQSFKIDDNLSLILDGFPPNTNANKINAKLRIHLINNNNGDTVTPHTVTIAVQGGIIKVNSIFNGYSGSTAGRTVNPIVLRSQDPVVIDFWSYDNGSTVFMDYVGQFV
jgi:hypothetical protein